MVEVPDIIIYRMIVRELHLLHQFFVRAFIKRRWADILGLGVISASPPRKTLKG